MHEEIRARAEHRGDADRVPGARDAGGAETSTRVSFWMFFVLNEKMFLSASRSRRSSSRRSLRRVPLARRSSPVGTAPESCIHERMLRLHLRPPAERGDERRDERHPQRAAEPENEHLSDSQADRRSARAVERDSASTGGGSVATFPLGFAAPSAVVWFVTLFRSTTPRRGVAHSVHCTTAGDVSDRRCLPGARRAGQRTPCGSRRTRRRRTRRRRHTA